MSVDRYTKLALTWIALALGVIAAHPWLGPGPWGGLLEPGPAEAQRRRREITLPAGWGRVVGFSDGYALLEASDGTLRQVGLSSGSVASLVRRK
jgi:hypothetical protein